MKSLRDSILQADDLGEEIVDVPEWDTKVLVRGMDGRQFEKARLQYKTGGSETEANAAVLTFVARDPDTGELIFDPADKDVLLTKNAGVVQRIVLTAIRLSGSNIDEAEAEVDADPTFVGA